MSEEKFILAVVLIAVGYAVYTDYRDSERAKALAGGAKELANAISRGVGSTFRLGD